MFGTEIPSSEYRPQRDGIGEIARTPAGNVAIRIGREVHPGAQSWEQCAYVVLTPREVAAVMTELGRAVEEA